MVNFYDKRVQSQACLSYALFSAQIALFVSFFRQKIWFIGNNSLTLHLRKCATFTFSEKRKLYCL